MYVYHQISNIKYPIKCLVLVAQIGGIAGGVTAASLAIGARFQILEELEP